MSEKPVSYSKTFTISETKFAPAKPPMSEEMRLVRESLSLMTGGCGSCTNFANNFCGKHKKPMTENDPRCDYFSRRTLDSSGESTKSLYRNAVYEMLGVRGDTLDRLSGT